MTMQRSSGGWTMLNLFPRRSVQPVTGSPGPWNGLAAGSGPATIWLQRARFRPLRDGASSPHVSIPKPGILRWPAGAPIPGEAAPRGTRRGGHLVIVQGGPLFSYFDCLEPLESQSSTGTPPSAQLFVARSNGWR